MDSEFTENRELKLNKKPFFTYVEFSLFFLGEYQNVHPTLSRSYRIGFLKN